MKRDFVPNVVLEELIALKMEALRLQAAVSPALRAYENVKSASDDAWRRYRQREDDLRIQIEAEAQAKLERR